MREQTNWFNCSLAFKLFEPEAETFLYFVLWTVPPYALSELLFEWILASASSSLIVKTFFQNISIFLYSSIWGQCAIRQSRIKTIKNNKKFYKFKTSRDHSSACFIDALARVITSFSLHFGEIQIFESGYRRQPRQGAIYVQVRSPRLPRGTGGNGRGSPSSLACRCEAATAPTVACRILYRTCSSGPGSFRSARRWVQLWCSLVISSLFVQINRSAHRETPWNGFAAGGIVVTRKRAIVLAD